MKNFTKLKEYIINKEHHTYRRQFSENLAATFCAHGLSPIERMTRRFEILTQAETPVVFPDERIPFLRTITKLPDIFTEEEWADIRRKHFIHESGFHSNMTADYEKVLKCGLAQLEESADEYSARCIRALLALCNRYRTAAEKAGNIEVADMFDRIPRKGAENFYEALFLLRIVHYGLWLEGNYHVTLGRLDKYLYTYYEKDRKSGMTREEGKLLTEEFFLSLNRDSDLYPGVQQGDNGQSLVLGGKDEKGRDVFNELSELCLEASGSLMLIDPKINIRVGKNTPVRIFDLGTELTKKGLGFPQYTNDDIAIPALQALGYDYEDAVNYGMAACWELIVPKVGAGDIVNIGALSFAKVIDRCLHRDLAGAETMERFVQAVEAEIECECNEICNGIRDLWVVPSLFLNICTARTESGGYKYNNFGIHGTGIATAADSLAAIEKYVYSEKSITKKGLIDAVDGDFQDAAELLHKLRYDTPKVGQNDDFADKYLVRLLACFSAALEGRVNCMGGRYRAGTGSAMYYLWHADEIGASPDGRRKGEPLGTNFSVSLFADIGGPFSVIQSMTKPNFLHAMNGGPVTLEFSSSVWSDADSVKKFAKFIKCYIDMGGHQIQLNSVNPETLKDAQAHPERYPHLVVRIWGWSAYFAELDKCYQDHVIARQEYRI